MKRKIIGVDLALGWLFQERKLPGDERLVIEISKLVNLQQKMKEKTGSMLALRCKIRRRSMAL